MIFICIIFYIYRLLLFSLEGLMHFYLGQINVTKFAKGDEIFFIRGYF